MTRNTGSAGAGTGATVIAGADASRSQLPPLPALLRDASPLTGVDMVEADRGGIVAWKVRRGDIVKQGDTLGEILNIEDPDAPRVPVVAKTSGVIFSMSRHKLVRPGQVIIKVAGKEPLNWRTGNLLTSR
jgi:uncharacterized protein